MADQLNPRDYRVVVSFISSESGPVSSLLRLAQETDGGMPVLSIVHGHEQKILKYLNLEVHSNHEQR